MSWEKLHTIIKENRERQAQERAELPTTCPIDGELLDTRGDIRNCPLGNYQWPCDGEF